MKNLSKIFAMIVFFYLAACTNSSLIHDSDFDHTSDKTSTEVSEKEIKITDLPSPVNEAIAINYVRAELLEADEITHVDGKITYDVEIKYESKIIEVMYDPQGNFLGEEEDDGDDEDGNGME